MDDRTTWVIAGVVIILFIIFGIYVTSGCKDYRQEIRQDVQNELEQTTR